MSDHTDEIRDKIVMLLEHGTEVVGLKLCFRYMGNPLKLPSQWWLHLSEACLLHKDNPDEVSICLKYAEETTYYDLIRNPDGMIRRCPFGHTEIAAPVMVDGFYNGAVFGGPCWTGRGNPPHPALTVPPNRKWLRVRLSMLRCVAGEISNLMQSQLPRLPIKRRQQIMDYVQHTIGGKPELGELSKRLSLSPGRTAHLIKELFGTNLSLLSRRHKLTQAAVELTGSDLPVGEIAFRFGFVDQNYFSRIFSQHFGISPSLYRHKYSSEV